MAEVLLAVLPKTAPRLFLIDAYALIYRSFFAFVNRPLLTSRGENTSAPWGFVNFLLTIRERHRPDYLAVVFDAGMSHREKEYPEYKGTREKMPDELRSSLPRIRALLGAFHDEVVELEGYEADDVIGTLAKQASEAGLETVIVSGDKDFYQLIRPGVRLLNPGRGGPTGVAEEWVDISNASERLGVPPERVVDFLALVGDSSDNIPGAPGIGEIWARRLLAEVGSLDELLAEPERIPWQGKRDAIAGHVDQIRTARRLVTIQTDLPVKLDLESLRVQPPDLDRLREICVELEFKTLVEKFSSAQEASAEAVTREGGGGRRYRSIRDPAELPALARAARAGGTVAIDARTDSTDPNPTDPMRAKLVGISLSWEPGSAIYLPLAHEYPPGSLLDIGLDAAPVAEPPLNLPPLSDPRMSTLVELLGEPGVAKVGQNLKRDLLILRRSGVRLRGVGADTMVASYVLDPGRKEHSLQALSMEFLSRPPTLYEDVTGKGKSRIPFSHVSVERAGEYACGQADLTLQLWHRFRPELEAKGLDQLFREMEMPLVPVLAEMEWNGIRIEPRLFAEMSRTLERDLGLIREEIYKLAGGEFNVNSNPQLRELLFEKLGLPVIRKTKTGPSTEAVVLEELADRGYDLPRHLLEYRQLEKLRSTYVDALPRLVNPDTGRIHASFNQTVAATGRISSSDPNLQNIPIRTDVGREIRKGFIPDPGYLFLAADYSQIELRILAHFSGDAAFVEAFEKDGDVHRQTAAAIFGVDIEKVTDEQRGRAKTINFATLYGQGEFSLARQLGISREEAGGFIRQYFERFSGVRRFLDEQVASAKEKGYVETLSGRRRYIPELASDNWSIRQFGERVAQNTPLQGTAADLIKVAMIRIHAGLAERWAKARLLLQVHDELIFEVPESDVSEVQDFVVAEMEGAMRLRVPLKVDVGVGRSWFECSG
ncbi:MAG: DNA polymerase I [Gemmatimonadetes bacterium]|nr:DNA polymerase I [Gemmatimonadota bacterium]